MAAQHVNAAVVRPRQIRPGLSVATERVVLRALEKEPALRFRDAAEMRQALLAVAEATGSADSIAQSSIDRTQRMLPRVLLAPVSRRWAATAAALVVLAIVVVPLVAAARQTTVPELGGRSVQDAQATGLTLAIDEQTTEEDSPAGVVVSQDPPANRNVGSGATVHAVVWSAEAWPCLIWVDATALKRARRSVRRAGR